LLYVKLRDDPAVISRALLEAQQLPPSADETERASVRRAAASPEAASANPQAAQQQSADQHSPDQHSASEPAPTPIQQ
jgi:hypothetical protein